MSSPSPASRSPQETVAVVTSTRNPHPETPGDVPSPRVEAPGRGRTPSVEEVRATAKRRRRQHLALVWVLRLALLAVILVGWQMSARYQWVNPTFTSKPTSIWDALIRDVTGDIPEALKVTLYETLAGFALASIAGFLLGCLLYEVRLADAVLQPFLTAFNSLPRIALAPLFVLWFGLGSSSRIALVFSLVVFIMIANTYAGLRQGDRDYLMLAKQLGARGLRRFGMFVLPAAVPTIFAGLQLGLIYAFLGAVAGEMLGGSGGVGAELSTSLATFRTDDFMAELIILVLVTVVFSAAMRAVERRLLRWQRFELRGVGGTGS